MEFAFEVVEGDLAHDSVDHVLDLAGEHDFALGIVLGLIEHCAEGEHLSEDGCGLGEGQGGR